MKKILVLILALVFPAAASAEEPLLGRSHWSIEIKGGTFTPAIDNWAQFYGRKEMLLFEGSLAYKILRQVEVGIGAGRAQDKGQAYAPGHGTLAGEVTYELIPLNVFVVARGILKEDQWVVPYIGGGWTRMYYREKLEDQGTVRGSADGYHVRGGLQFSLNIFDERSANNMFTDYSIYQTYLFIEVEETKAIVKADSVDLGGTSYLLGLRFEF